VGDLGGEWKRDKSGDGGGGVDRLGGRLEGRARVEGEEGTERRGGRVERSMGCKRGGGRGNKVG